MRHPLPHARLCAITAVLWAALGWFVRESEGDPRVLRELQPPRVCGVR